MITVTTKCSKCQNVYTWSSQPMLLGRFPACNLLLSFSILCAGASVKKMLLVLKHMNVLIYNESTYYYHQKHLLIPSIVATWKNYQKALIDQLKGVQVALAGDGRHDSMGHSAKYCTYTIFCCTIGLIINIVLVQVMILSFSICLFHILNILHNIIMLQLCHIPKYASGLILYVCVCDTCQQKNPSTHLHFDNKLILEFLSFMQG